MKEILKLNLQLFAWETGNTGTPTVNRSEERRVGRECRL